MYLSALCLVLSTCLINCVPVYNNRPSDNISFPGTYSNNGGVTTSIPSRQDLGVRRGISTIPPPSRTGNQGVNSITTNKSVGLKSTTSSVTTTKNTLTARTDVRAATASRTDLRVPTTPRTDVRAPTVTRTDLRAPTTTRTDVRAATAPRTDVRAATTSRTDVRAPTTPRTDLRAPTTPRVNERRAATTARTTVSTSTIPRTTLKLSSIGTDTPLEPCVNDTSSDIVFPDSPAKCDVANRLMISAPDMAIRECPEGFKMNSRGSCRRTLSRRFA